MNSICVFCGSNAGSQNAYLESAEKLGTMLAVRNIRLVYGGANVGLMGMVANACMNNGGEVIGVMPRSLVEAEVAHPNLNDLRVVESMHERKALMAKLSDGFISLPGGIGTLEETFEMFTWAQLGIQGKPIGLLNILGFYDKLFEFLQHVVRQDFLMADHLDMLLMDADVQNLLDKLKHFVPQKIEKWRSKKNPTL